MTDDNNDGHNIPKWRQKMSERLAALHGYPAPNPEIVLKPDERERLQRLYTRLEADFEKRKELLFEIAFAKYALKEAKFERPVDPELIVSLEEDVDEAEKALAKHRMERSDLVLLRGVERLIQEYRKAMQ